MDFKAGEIIHINKPYGMSSFGALAFVRTRLSKACHVRRLKTGHAGTLDPLATGVLTLCTGKCTKMIPQLQYHSKEYTARLQFGATTASYDREHTVNFTYPTAHVTEEMVRRALRQFEGDIMQVPPTYSAVKVAGKRAFAYRRNDEEVKLQAKAVHVERIELMEYDNDRKTAFIRVECGKGTYIRSLCRDIGRAVGSGAFLTELTRTRLGDVRIEDCIRLDDFQAWLDRQEIAGV